MDALARVLTAAAVVATSSGTAWAQPADGEDPSAESGTLSTVTVSASADASAEGLSPAYPGGQVARGGRAGILGTRDNLETPFSITSYTAELIQDRQARSVGEVLLNDPGVRVARGFGNFQESYFIRGFIVGSDDVAFNGLYNLLPRQYIATELFERVEVLRGASAFLNGAAPAGGGIGGAINLLPKRAPNEPLSRLTLGAASGGHGSLAVDLARRFGPDQSTGIRLNAAYKDGGTAIDDEEARLGLLALGLDWRSRDVRLSADLGWQDHRLEQTRGNVTLVPGVTTVPRVPDPSNNYSQPWTFSNERDVFGTFRGEVDITPSLTAWGAYGLRRSKEANSLDSFDVIDGASGAAVTTRFDNARRDRVDTAELGLRGKLRTGTVGHEWVVSASWFEIESRNAYAWDFFNELPVSLYSRVRHPRPDFSDTAFTGNDMDSPGLTFRTRLLSFALGDTLSFANDRVLLTLGVRHQKIEATNFAYDTGKVLDDYDESRTSPVAGIVFKASSRISLYANYIEGLSQGDTAPLDAANPGAALPPYVSRQREIGVKYDGGRLGASAALFSITQPRALLDAAGVFRAGGEDRHRGVELNVFGEAMRGLRVLGGVTWLEAEQRSTGSDELNGNRVIGVPRLQANLGAEWDVPGAAGLTVDGRVIHTRSSYADAANALEVPGWTRLDIGARYFMDVQGKLLTLRARIDNLTDRAYWASAGGYPGAGYLVVGAPRTVTLSASLDF